MTKSDNPKNCLSEGVAAEMKNRVIAGDYTVKSIHQSFGNISISTSLAQKIMIDRVAVYNYEDMEQRTRKSASSAACRSAIGVYFFGPVGLAAGLTAKKKGTHLVALEFRDRKRSLI